MRLLARLGDPQGTASFNRQLGQPETQDPEVTIDRELERQKSEYYPVLFKPNLEYKRGAEPPPPPLLQPKQWSPPSGHRLTGEVTLGSGYTGLSPLAEAARMAGVGTTVLDAELQPRLRQHLEKRFPEARHYTDVRQLLSPETQGAVQVFQMSPTCIAFADPNKFKQGGEGAEFGQAYEHCGVIVEHMKPLRAYIECTKGVLTRGLGRADKGEKNKMSAVDRLKQNTPSY